MLWASTLVMAVMGMFYILHGIAWLFFKFENPVFGLHTHPWKIYKDPDSEAGNTAYFERSQRLCGYILIMLGVPRLLTAVFWGCGYAWIGVAMCLTEISIMVHEILVRDDVVLEKALEVVVLNVVLAVLYIWNFAPSCS